MCLDFSDEEDEQYANRTINPETGRPLRDTDVYVEDPTEDCFIESVIIGLWKLIYDLVDIEKLFFPVFFGHKRKL